MFIDIRAAIASLFSLIGLALIASGLSIAVSAGHQSANAPAPASVLTDADPKSEIDHSVATRWPDQSERGRIFLSNTGSLGREPPPKQTSPVDSDPVDNAPAAIARILDRADQKAAVQAAAEEALLLADSRNAQRAFKSFPVAAVPLPTPRPRNVKMQEDFAAPIAQASQTPARDQTKRGTAQATQTKKSENFFQSLFSR
jgi:hypothetical protein